jgi:hypothetical protein
MFFVALAIIAVCSTGIVLVLRDRKPRPQTDSST